MKIEALCEAPPEALTHSPSQMPLSCPVVPMAAGGMGPYAFTESCSLALLFFSRASEGPGAFDGAAGCSWGVPWGRGACVDVRRVWGVGGVVPMAAGGVGPRAFTASCFFSAILCKGLRSGKSIESSCWLLLGIAMGPRYAC